MVAHTQVRFRTVVPQRPVAPGESFQVQYIVENAGEISNFLAPQFDGFRVVAGPNVYAGDRSSSHRNVVFTLAAIDKGRFKIYGATCTVNGKLVKSNDAFVEVAALEEPGESPYFLRMGEDPYEKINENLFLKLILDKRTCFIGEPLVATFKLYSRLQSRSNVVKNPGFYGFSVYDMVDVNDQVLSEEKLDGHWFQVHTIRKVQLYPLQAGSFSVDAMEVANDVEFSRSIVNKQTEQEITEKMYGVNETKKEKDASAEVYHVNLKTDPVVIDVKSLPKKNAADTFAGAVGVFSMDAYVEKDSLNQNEENYLTVRINGSGNFQRVNAPLVSWPSALEGFEPLVTDTLNKQLVPLTGQRNFRYAFSSAQPGLHIIPPIAFSFFNLKTHAYKTIATRPVTVFVSFAEKEPKTAINKLVANDSSKRSAWWMLAAVLLLLAAIAFGVRSILLKQYNERKENIQTEAASSSVTVEQILAPAQANLDNEDKIFYKELNNAVWNYLHCKVGVSGSQMSKAVVRKVLFAKNVRPDLVDDIIDLVRQSEIGSYTSAQMNLTKTEIFQKAKSTLQAIGM
jgi:oxygen tolerance protein BatD